MNADRWKEITRIYGAVVASAPHERAAAMAAMCGDDPALRQEVESLLDESDERPMVLDTPPWDVVGGHDEAERHLAAGTTLGLYRIVSLLGAGGMGEVYRARDSRLNRDVALKVLPATVADDPDRLARFTREAQVLASLNHPNIGAIYGLEEGQVGRVGPVGQAGQAGRPLRFLVMELVEGDDLSRRIASGAIALDEALSIARQIAEALEAAHEQGIIHRDLKPANIKVRPDGTVKVLDFGLAKIVEAGGAGGAGRGGGAGQTGWPDRTDRAGTTLGPGRAISDGPTAANRPEPDHATLPGMILGTAAYMSPEQARGKPADKRSDVWAFGCVLYEMLSGRQPFTGDGAAEIIASVLKNEPDWTVLPADLPPAIPGLIRGCLRRDRRERVGDIAAALFVLRERFDPGMASSLRHPPTPVRRRAAIIGMVVALALALATTVLWRRDPRVPSTVTRFAFTLPAGQQLANNRRGIAISPDGATIAYTADGRMYLRRLDDFATKDISGVDRGIMPTFSPDSQSLAFVGTGSINRIGVDGGTPLVLNQVPVSPTSLAWAGDSILFTDTGTAIMRIAAAGGKPEIVVDLRNSEELAYNPQLLADGDTLLFGTVKRASSPMIRWDEAQVVVQSLRTGQRTLLIERAIDAQYVPSGHIVYTVAGTLFAVPFDAASRRLTGAPVPVVEGVSVGITSRFGHWANYAFSAAGSLAYVPGPRAPALGLSLIDGAGAAVPLAIAAGTYEYPRASSDGKRIAFGTITGNETVVSIYDIDSPNAPQRLTFEGNNRFPIWSADGTQVAFQSDRDHDRAIFAQRIDSGVAVRLTHPGPEVVHVPESWSPDGKTLLYTATEGPLSSLWTLSLSDRKVERFSNVQGSSLPTDAVFSPDGRWVAYQAAKGVVFEGTTYVEPFPPNGTVYEAGVGGRPLWSRDGKQLFLVPGASRLNVVGITAEHGRVAFTPPVAVRRPFGIADPTLPRPYDLMPDGRFLVVRTAGDPEGEVPGAPAQIRVVLNWFEELKRLAPAK